MNNRYQLFILASIWLVSCTEKTYQDEIYTKPKIVADPSSNFLSPEASLESFYLPKGYRVELVASEPIINEPVAITWDGNGVMYVAQMETYMQNIDGDGTDVPVSRIMRLEDTDGDGKMDKSSVFIDSLMLPRMIMTLDARLVVNETYSYDLWSYRDTDHDGVADEKIRIYRNENNRGGNLEHQQSGLVWNLDNWVYSTTNPIRFRFSQNALQVDTLHGMPGGQWGLTQDDMGHMYYSAAGGENPAFGFQQPVNYGHFNPEGRLAEGFMEPWPVIGTPDIQGSSVRLREDGTLNHFTGVAGQEIFRGHRLPPSTYGDLFIPEPVGRLIRRAKVKTENGKKVLYNAYDEKEFITSTDLNFRPVQAKTGPDGCLYIVDMYRGIIQESNWTREGSDIRRVIIRKELDKNIGKGRIYRIVHEQIEPDTRPNLLDKAVTELVDYLGHPNGWYRITAQKLIILKNDASMIPLLREMAMDNESFWSFLSPNDDYGLGRIHALWTLEGLGAIDKELIKVKINDTDPRVRMTAIRLSENFLKNGDSELLINLEGLQSDPNIEVINQLALSLRYSTSKMATNILNDISKIYSDHYIISTSVNESLKKNDSDLQKLKERISNQPTDIKNRILNGYDIYKQLCITCHGSDLKGTKKEDGSLLAPPLIGSDRVKGDEERLVKILLHGLTGPIDGTDYGIMMSVGNNSDEWVANVASYIRNLNDASPVEHHSVKEIRKRNKDRARYWTLKELEYK